MDLAWVYGMLQIGNQFFLPRAEDSVGVVETQLKMNSVGPGPPSLSALQFARALIAQSRVPMVRQTFERLATRAVRSTTPREFQDLLGGPHAVLPTEFPLAFHECSRTAHRMFPHFTADDFGARRISSDDVAVFLSFLEVILFCELCSIV